MLKQIAYLINNNQRIVLISLNSLLRHFSKKRHPSPLTSGFFLLFPVLFFPATSWTLSPDEALDPLRPASLMFAISLTVISWSILLYIRAIQLCSSSQVSARAGRHMLGQFLGRTRLAWRSLNCPIKSCFCPGTSLAKSSAAWLESLPDC